MQEAKDARRRQQASGGPCWFGRLRHESRSRRVGEDPRHPRRRPTRPSPRAMARKEVRSRDDVIKYEVLHVTDARRLSKEPLVHQRLARQVRPPEHLAHPHEEGVQRVGEEDADGAVLEPDVTDCEGHGIEEQKIRLVAQEGDAQEARTSQDRGVRHELVAPAHLRRPLQQLLRARQLVEVVLELGAVEAVLDEILEVLGEVARRLGGLLGDVQRLGAEERDEVDAATGRPPSLGGGRGGDALPLLAPQRGDVELEHLNVLKPSGVGHAREASAGGEAFLLVGQVVAELLHAGVGVLVGRVAVQVVAMELGVEDHHADLGDGAQVDEAVPSWLFEIHVADVRVPEQLRRRQREPPEHGVGEAQQRVGGRRRDVREPRLRRGAVLQTEALEEERQEDEGERQVGSALGLQLVPLVGHEDLAPGRDGLGAPRLLPVQEKHLGAALLQHQQRDARQLEHEQQMEQHFEGPTHGRRIARRHLRRQHEVHALLQLEEREEVAAHGEERGEVHDVEGVEEQNRHFEAEVTADATGSIPHSTGVAVRITDPQDDEEGAEDGTGRHEAHQRLVQGVGALAVLDTHVDDRLAQHVLGSQVVHADVLVVQLQQRREQARGHVVLDAQQQREALGEAQHSRCGRVVAVDVDARRGIEEEEASREDVVQLVSGVAAAVHEVQIQELRVLRQQRLEVAAVLVLEAVAHEHPAGAAGGSAAAVALRRRHAAVVEARAPVVHAQEAAIGTVARDAELQAVEALDAVSGEGQFHVDASVVEDVFGVLVVLQPGHLGGPVSAAVVAAAALGADAEEVEAHLRRRVEVLQHAQVPQGLASGVVLRRLSEVATSRGRGDVEMLEAQRRQSLDAGGGALHAAQHAGVSHLCGAGFVGHERRDEGVALAAQRSKSGVADEAEAGGTCAGVPLPSHERVWTGHAGIRVDVIANAGGVQGPLQHHPSPVGTAGAALGTKRSSAGIRLQQDLIGVQVPLASTVRRTRRQRAVDAAGDAATVVS
eukprot:scaffold335_cov253-Pinguiococcus_pyrenoidosus.AAC.10